MKPTDLPASGLLLVAALLDKLGGHVILDEATIARAYRAKVSGYHDLVRGVHVYELHPAGTNPNLPDGVVAGPVGPKVAQLEVDSADALMTPKDAAKALDVQVRTLARQAEAGKLRCSKTPGGHRRYFREDIAQLLRSGVKLEDDPEPAQATG